LSSADAETRLSVRLQSVNAGGGNQTERGGGCRPCIVGGNYQPDRMLEELRTLQVDSDDAM